MNILRHLRENLFVTATGSAAFVHTTWAIGTLFSGIQPMVTASLVGNSGMWVAQSWAALWWHIPSALLALALDVGQVVTSYRIRKDHERGAKPIRKYITFGVFAVATYYLQWLYMAHHLPDLPLALGVRAESQDAVTYIRDLALWFLPLLLPLSTFLYTISDMDEGEPEARIQPVPVSVQRVIITEEPVELLPLDMPLLDVPNEASTYPPLLRNHNSGEHTGELVGAVRATDDGFIATCPLCGKEEFKTTFDSAQSWVNVHTGRWCPTLRKVEQDVEAQ